MREQIKKMVPVAGLVIMFLLFAFTTDGKFLTRVNLQNLIIQSAITMVGWRQEKEEGSLDNDEG